jgi:hypothetical protein
MAERAVVDANLVDAALEVAVEALSESAFRVPAEAIALHEADRIARALCSTRPEPRG